MEVSEIRNAFLLTSGIEDKIRDFRLGRIARISAKDTPFPIIDGAIAILHIIPLQSFTGNWNFPLEEVYQMVDEFQPIETSGFSRQTNLDGVLFYSGGFKEEEMVNYTQVFRNGVVEAIEIYPPYGDDKSIPGINLEQNLNESMERYIKSLLKLDLRFPFIIFISLINLTGFTFATGRFRRRFAKSPNIPNGMILCPDILLETEPSDFKVVLRPAFDTIWNTYGFLCSPSYSDDGI